MHARLAAVVASVVALGGLPSARAAAQSEFWRTVRTPGLRAYRHELDEARRLLGQNDAGAAATVASHAADRLPTLPDAHVLLGQALIASGRRPEAVAAFRRAFEADPHAFDEPALAQTVATTAMRAGDAELARMTAERAVARLPPGAARADLQRLLADLLLAEGPPRLRAAIAHYRDALRTLPRDPRVRAGLAVALARAGEETELAIVVRGARTLSDGLLEAIGLPAAEQAARRAARALDPDGRNPPGSPTPAALWEAAARESGPWVARDHEIAGTIAVRLAPPPAPATPPAPRATPRPLLRVPVRPRPILPGAAP